MLFSEAITAFTAYIRFEKRYSQHTLRSYADDLQQFSDFISQQFDCSSVSDISPAFIRSWLASVKDHEMSAKTINRKISSLRTFFKFLLKQGIIQGSPMVNIVSQKQSKRLPYFIDKKEIEGLWKHADFPDNWSGRTERLLLMLFYQTGMRLSEVINLKESQIDGFRHSIKVLGKGNKERIIPAHKLLMDELESYRNEKRKAFEKFDETVLFVNEKGKKLYSKQVYNIVRKYLDAATTIEKRSPHVLRHSFATHLLNEGADLNAVKELLGHSSLAATQVYTHNTIEKLKEVFEKAHPKA